MGRAETLVMHRGPLWQFFLSTALGLFAAHRATIAFLYLGKADEPLLGVGYLLQAALGAVVALGVWLGRRWVLAPLLSLGLVIVLSAVLGSILWDRIPIVSAVGQSAATLLLTGGLWMLLHAEFRKGESNRERARREANDPSR